MNRSPSFSVHRGAGVTVMEMVVVLFILSLFVLIFVQLDLLVRSQNEGLRTLEGEQSSTFQAMAALVHDIHSARQAHPLGPHGLRLVGDSSVVEWMSVSGTVVRRVDGKTMFRIPSNRLQVRLGAHGTVTVESEAPPLRVTAVVGGL